MTSERKSGGEYVLETRHLLGVFFLAVFLCGLFFFLGYLYGRRIGVSAALPAQPAQPPPASVPAKPADLGFYERVEGKRLEPPPAGSVPAKPQEPPSVVAGASTAPAPPGGAPPLPAKRAGGPGQVFLQVAALKQQADAERLAGELYKLGFPAQVQPPAAPELVYRVQVGPFENAELAEAAKHRLEAHGFKPLIRR